MYPNVISTIRPFCHTDALLDSMLLVTLEELDDQNDDIADSTELDFMPDPTETHLIAQIQLNDLSLSKVKTELLATDSKNGV